MTVPTCEGILIIVILVFPPYLPDCGDQVHVHDMALSRTKYCVCVGYLSVRLLNMELCMTVM